MSPARPTYEELLDRLAQAEQLLAALGGPATPLSGSSGPSASAQASPHDASSSPAYLDPHRVIAIYGRDWTFWRNEEGRLVYVSPSCEAMTGYTATEFLADPELLRHMVHPEDRPRFSAHLDKEQRAACDEEDEEDEEIVFRIVRRDGTERWLEHCCRSVCLGGRFLGTSVAHRDVTTRIQREQELLRRNASLQQARDEALALAEQQAARLRVLNWELTQAEQRERRHLAQALHDHLQQILVAARLKLGVLRRCVDGESGRRLVEQIDGMLGAGIAETRSLTTRLAPPVLYEAGLRAALEWLAEQMKQTFGLHVGLQLDPAAEPEAEDARVLLFFAVREMLFNVVKHAEVGTAHIETTRTEDDRVQIVVRDSGKGIDPATFSSSLLGASGFGLANARERLELIGGQITVHSAPGQGTQITISAPCAALPPADPLHPPSRDPTD